MIKPRQLSLQVVCGHLLLAALLRVQVHGHGYLESPPSRNWLGKNSNPVLTYTPHGGNGRGEGEQQLPGGLTACAVPLQYIATSARWPWLTRCCCQPQRLRQSLCPNLHQQQLRQSPVPCCSHLPSKQLDRPGRRADCTPLMHVCHTGLCLCLCLCPCPRCVRGPL